MTFLSLAPHAAQAQDPGYADMGGSWQLSLTYTGTNTITTTGSDGVPHKSTQNWSDINNGQDVQNPSVTVGGGNSFDVKAEGDVTVTATWIPDADHPDAPAPAAVYVQPSAEASWSTGNSTNNIGYMSGSGTANDGLGDDQVVDSTHSNGVSSSANAQKSNLVRLTGSPASFTKSISVDVTGSVTRTAQFGSIYDAGQAHWSFSAAIVHPHPINFVLSPPGQTGSTMTIDWLWDSSTGHLQDLSGCKIGERVTYDGNPGRYVFGIDDDFPGFYYPPNPPFDAQHNNPTITNVGDPTAGHWPDDHYAPGFTHPYQNSSYTGIQAFRYQCDDMPEGLWVSLGVSQSITRSISEGNFGQYLYTISEGGASNPPYPIGSN